MMKQWRCALGGHTSRRRISRGGCPRDLFEGFENYVVSRECGELEKNLCQETKVGWVERPHRYPGYRCITELKQAWSWLLEERYELFQFSALDFCHEKLNAAPRCAGSLFNLIAPPFAVT